MRSIRATGKPVVIAVDPQRPYPCRVHPLGYLSTMEESFKPSMLKAMGTIATEPLGGIANDPYLLAAQGKKAFKPSAVVQGSYECYGLSGSHLTPRMALNFSIVDEHRYKDASGAAGSYRFDAKSAGLVFECAALDGQRASYAQPSNPPNRKTPPAVTFAVSGDSCDLKMCGSDSFGKCGLADGNRSAKIAAVRDDRCAQAQQAPQATTEPGLAQVCAIRLPRSSRFCRNSSREISPFA